MGATRPIGASLDNRPLSRGNPDFLASRESRSIEKKFIFFQLGVDISA